jgi:hypothetical protein
MSTGHRVTQAKSEAELTKIAGEGDTPELLARPVKCDTSHDVPYGGGISVDGKTVYIDRRLHAEAMHYRQYDDGDFVPQRYWIIVRGLDGKQLIVAWIDHEHGEWSIDAGDNPVDSYGAAHAFASALEDRAYEASGLDPDKVNDAVTPALDRCAKRDPVNPPRDLWCGPYLDIAFSDDGADGRRAKEILRIFRSKNVADAFKLSKIEVHYGMGPDQCTKCTHFAHDKALYRAMGGGDLAPCEVVCGVVRKTRDCDRFEER